MKVSEVLVTETQSLEMAHSPRGTAVLKRGKSVKNQEVRQRQCSVRGGASMESASPPWTPHRLHRAKGRQAGRGQLLAGSFRKLKALGS